MKHGELSNRTAPTLLIRIEDFLVEYKDKTKWDKLANFVVGKESRATLNMEVLDLLFLIFRNTDLTVDLVVDKKNSSKELKDLIADIPYGRLVEIDKPVEISIKLNSGVYLYYIDDDLERVSIIGNKRAITSETLNTYIKGGFTFE